jgi:Ca-activated chloride channel family protein
MSDKPSQHDDLADRLVHQALAEALGGRRPSNLTDRIVAAATVDAATNGQTEPSAVVAASAGGDAPETAHRPQPPVAVAPQTPAEDKPSPAPVETVAPAAPARRRKWVEFLVAVSLLVAIGGFLAWPAVQEAMHTVNLEQRLVTLGPIYGDWAGFPSRPIAPLTTPEPDETSPSGYYLQDDVEYLPSTATGHGSRHRGAMGLDAGDLSDAYEHVPSADGGVTVTAPVIESEDASVTQGVFDALDDSEPTPGSQVEGLVRGGSDYAPGAGEGQPDPAAPNASDGEPLYETRTKNSGYSVTKPVYETKTEGDEAGAPADESGDGLSRERFAQRPASPDDAKFGNEARDSGLLARLDAEQQVAGEAIVQLEEATRPDEGRGPGQGGDRYARIVDNAFLAVVDHPLSTFSIDVDTASYSKARRYLMQNGILPPPDAVRIEEFVNYFAYDYAPPEGDAPFAAHIEVAACPWRPEHRLVRVGLKGREIAAEKRPASNLVFLLDVSGSMEPEDRLPRVRRCLRMLVDQLGENDRVAIVVYAGASGLVLDSTPGYRKEEIVSALDRLQAGGSTNGGEGILLAYDVAAAHFIPGSTNRVILCTDGDFNVGTTSTADLQRIVEEKAKTKVFLSVLGFGMDNHNDAMLETLADKGNGNYGYIDTEEEGHKLLVDQIGGTLVAIAKDVKIQLEFNPAQVAGYRLIGYENRLLAAQDFNDDTKGAGEIGAGHTVTALYEIVPAGQPVEQPDVDELKYQRPQQLTDAAANGELMTLKIRYKDPEADTSHEPLVFAVTDAGAPFGAASPDFKFAAAVAAYGMLLRGSPYAGNATLDGVLEIAGEGLSNDQSGYRAAFLDVVRQTKTIAGQP